MEIKDFLRMCQKCEVLEYKNLTEELYVWHNGVKYLPYRCEIAFKSGNIVYSPIIKDLKANAVYYVDLENLTKQE